MKGMFRSFSNRNFRLFIIGQFISQTGNWMRKIASVLLVLQLTGSGFAIGLLTAFQFLPVLVLGAWTGLVADRLDKRKLLITVQSISILQPIGLVLVATSDSRPVTAIFALALAGGFATAFENPTRRAFIAELVPEELLQNAIGLNSSVMMGSRVFGPAIAGVLITTLGYGWTFGVDALTYIAVLGGLALMRPADLTISPKTPRGKRQIREGVTYVRRTPALWIPLGMAALIGTFAFNLSVVLPLFVTRSLDGSDQDFTTLFAVLSCGAIIGGLYSASRTSMSVRDLAFASTGFGISMLVLAAMPTIFWSLLPAFVIGAFSVGVLTSITTLIQVKTEPTMRGRVIALQTIVIMGSTPIGGPTLGVVSDAFGPRIAVVVGGAACLIASTWGLAAERRNATVATTDDAAMPISTVPDRH
jgi:MFS family permease